MRISLFAVLAIVGAAAAHASSTSEWRVDKYKDGAYVETLHGETGDAAWSACHESIGNTVAGQYVCKDLRFQKDLAPECTSSQPPDEKQTVQCTAPQTGSWEQSKTYAAAQYPTCWIAGPWIPETAPAGACQDPPPPQPVDCAGTWGDWIATSEWSACVNGSQSRTEKRSFSITTPPANGGAACPASPEPRTVSQACTPPVIANTVINFTDLALAPSGAFVTVYGMGLNAAVVGADVWTQTPTKTVLRWTGDGATIGGVLVPVIMRAGRVLEATPLTFASKCNALTAGDVLYLHAGTYTARCGASYNGRQLNLGGQFANTAIIGYPGETAVVRDVYMGDGTGKFGDGVTLANLSMSGNDCVFGASWWETEESGAKNVRVVGNTCRGTYGTGNTMTGLVAFGGDGWKVLGNDFSNNAPSPINNNHGVYINVGADDVEVAWNKFHDLKLGHVIQQHTDGPLRKYERNSIHDNELRGNNAQDMRGINISGCTADSTADIYNNVLINLGQNFSGIQLYCGTITVRQNTLSQIAAPALYVRGATATARNNILIGQPGILRESGTLTQINNVLTGPLDANNRPVTPVKAPGAGVPRDHAGVTRAEPATVGAYE